MGTKSGDFVQRGILLGGVFSGVFSGVGFECETIVEGTDSLSVSIGFIA